MAENVVELGDYGDIVTCLECGMAWGEAGWELAKLKGN